MIYSLSRDNTYKQACSVGRANAETIASNPEKYGVNRGYVAAAIDGDMQAHVAYKTAHGCEG